MKHFDLNIEKNLENWDTHHAIREIIANALDEQLLTSTEDVQMKKNGTSWHIRDYGRGLKCTHLTQKENQEKLSNQKMIGKFGIGLKDALATFDRKGIKVFIKSKYGEITIAKRAKEGFPDLKTLHANISDRIDSSFVGTQFTIDRITEKDIQNTKNLFLKFTGEKILEPTKIGQVIRKVGDVGNIYINGVKVAEEKNFLFSYNITHLTSPIRKALNRERTNVGRTAYTESIKKVLLACETTAVARELAEDLQKIQAGEAHDELYWLEVALHAIKILNDPEEYLFVSSTDLTAHRDMIDEAQASGLTIITIPDTLKNKIKNCLDVSGRPIVDISQFVASYNESFQFKFVELVKLE